jgi:primosomal protein N'
VVSFFGDRKLHQLFIPLRSQSIRARRLFISAKQTANERDVLDTTAAAAALLLLVVAEETTQAETAEELVDTQTTQEAVDKTTQTKTVQQLANQVENTSQQQTDGSNDLEQRLSEEAPERVELLLGVGHVGDLLLRVVDGSDDRSSELLQAVGKLVLLRSGLASLLAALSLSSDAAIGIETTERAVALVQDAATLFDERLDVVNKLLLVELVARCAIGLLDVLMTC